MPLFRVLIHGRNFRLKSEGKWGKFGFFTPRFVEAPDSTLAEQMALEDFRQSAKYLDLMGVTLNAEVDPPTLGGEDIEEVVRPAAPGQMPAGLALYPETSE